MSVRLNIDSEIITHWFYITSTGFIMRFIITALTYAVPWDTQGTSEPAGAHEYGTCAGLCNQSSSEGFPLLHPTCRKVCLTWCSTSRHKLNSSSGLIAKVKRAEERNIALVITSVFSESNHAMLLHTSHQNGYMLVQRSWRRNKQVCFASCVCFPPRRDFHFGHMDGSSYINNLIMR